MSVPELPPMPPGCSATVRQDGDTILITIPARWRSSIVRWILAGYLLLVATPLFISGVECNSDAFIIGILGSLAGAWLLVTILKQDRTEVALGVSSTWLAWSSSSPFGVRVKEWHRSQLMLIATERDLRVRARDREEILCAHLEPAEVAWLEDVLSDVLALENHQLPKQPGEISVHFRDTGTAEGWPGYLLVRDAEMSLRRRGQSGFQYVFFLAKNTPIAVARDWLTRDIPIAGENIQCRVEDGETACLKIDQPSLSLEIMIWCADKDALHAALARFWGATDKDTPA